jgi:ribosomal protein L11 methyltransferase
MTNAFRICLGLLVLLISLSRADGFQGILPPTTTAKTTTRSPYHGTFTYDSPSRFTRTPQLASTTGTTTVTSTSTDSDSDSNNASALRSLTFFNFPKDQEPGILCDFLMEIGACSAAIIDADRGTDLEVPIFGEPNTDPFKESWQGATAPVWNRCNVSAHFPASADLSLVLDLVAETFDEYATLRDDDSHDEQVVPDRDWVVHVQKSWKPIVVADRFVLRFPWHSDADVEKAVAASGGNIGSDSDSLVQLGLQGGIAFGTGEHPTTQLCLEWIIRLVTEHAKSVDESSSPSSKSLSILDYGTGSGVLGMAACKLAPELVTAVGIDIDVDAIRIANANSVDNNVSMRSYLPPLAETADDESKSLLLKAHAHAAGQLRERGEKADDLLLPASLESATYNVVVANILAGPLVALAPTLASLLQPGGLLGMSGILAHQDGMILEAYEAAGFENLSVEKEQGGWILVTGTKRL